MQGSKKTLGVAGIPYVAAVVDELVRAPKRSPLSLRAILDELRTGSLRIILEPQEALPGILEWVLNAGRLSEVKTFKSSLLINAERVRGIDFHALRRRRFYKEIVPAGWHEESIDPITGSTRHDGIAPVGVTDLHGFVLFVAGWWNIQVEREEELL